MGMDWSDFDEDIQASLMRVRLGLSTIADASMLAAALRDGRGRREEDTDPGDHRGSLVTPRSVGMWVDVHSSLEGRPREDDDPDDPEEP